MSELKNAISIADRLEAAGLPAGLGTALIEGDTGACSRVLDIAKRLSNERNQLPDSLKELQRTLEARQSEQNQVFLKLDNPHFHFYPIKDMTDILAQRDTLAYIIPLIQERIEANIKRQEALGIEETNLRPLADLAKARSMNNLPADSLAKDLGYSSSLDLVPVHIRQAYLRVEQERAEAKAKADAEMAEASRLRRIEEERQSKERSDRVEKELAAVPGMTVQEMVKRVAKESPLASQMVDYFSRPGVNSEAVYWFKQAYRKYANERDRQYYPVESAIMDRLAEVVVGREHAHEHELRNLARVTPEPTKTEVITEQEQAEIEAINALDLKALIDRAFPNTHTHIWQYLYTGTHGHAASEVQQTVWRKLETTRGAEKRLWERVWDRIREIQLEGQRAGMGQTMEGGYRSAFPH